MLVQTEYLPDRVNSQKEGDATRLRNSMSPLKSDEFVPPRVKTPPGAREDGELELGLRASQNDISGALSRLLSVTAFQKGIACVLARAMKAKPIRPDTGAFTRPVVIASTATTWCQYEEKLIILKDNHKMFETEL